MGVCPARRVCVLGAGIWTQSRPSASLAQVAATFLSPPGLQQMPHRHGWRKKTTHTHRSTQKDRHVQYVRCKATRVILFKCILLFAKQDDHNAMYQNNNTFVERLMCWQVFFFCGGHDYFSLETRGSMFPSAVH